MSWGETNLCSAGASALTLTLVAGILAGCNSTHLRTPPPPDATQFIREVDLTPRFPDRAHSAQPRSSAERSEPAVFYGESPPPGPAPRPSSIPANADSEVDDPATTGALPANDQSKKGRQGYEMNFENAPIATAAKAILGDILGVGYSIDQRVQGSTVSLSSGRAVPKKDLLYAFDSALRVSNVALVREGRSYRLVPLTEAVGTGSVDGGTGLEAGYGISVVPLQHVSAPTLAKLLDNFANKPGMVRADPARNLLVLQGSASDRRAAIDTAVSFDADWMRGQSIGIYPITNTAPEPIIAELERIIDAGEGGLSQNLVKLQSIARQNAILVVARKPELLKTASTWIRRLDKSGSAGTGVKVYRMQYGDARQVAALLNDMFTGGSGSGVDSGIDQLVPGGGVVASRNPAARPATSSRQSSTSFGGNEPRFADASGGSVGPAAAADVPGVQRTGGFNGFGPGAGPGFGPGAGPVLPGVRITPDVMNNALLIYANQENYQTIRRALEQIDRPQLQVAIEATIAEVTLNDSLSYGVQFFLKNKESKKDGSSIMFSTAKDAILNRILPGFNFLVGTDAEPRVIIDALHEVTKVKILSTPSIVVIDNQFASIQVGDQIPITTRTAQSVDVPTAPVVNSVDYRNTGVILRVAPRVNANGNVLLDIEQEISNVAKTATAETLTPTVSQRKVRSSIAVASGQTVLLGGLISDRLIHDRQGIPIIDQVPIIGSLIGSNSGAMQRTELIMFIRPQIIRHGVDAHRVAEELRAKLTGMQAGAPVRCYKSKC
jgi:general secretion pathway protein D